MPIARVALALVLFAGRVLAEESALYFARDSQTEMTLTPAAENETAWEIDLRRYYPPAENRHFGFMGTLKQDGSDFICVENRDDKQVAVRVRGSPRGETVTVETSGLEGDGPDEKFDGSYARVSREEQIARAKARFEAADALLNSTYQRLRAEARRKARLLREKQRDWIQHRDYMAEHGHAENPQESPSYWDMMLDLTISRIVFLAIWNGKDVPKGLSGRYIDGYGGHLELNDKGNSVDFSLSVVRGPTSHTGDLDGTARRRGAKLYYKEEIEPGEDRQPAELIFTPRDGHIVEVAGENTSHYHGARAYFDGTYYKERRAENDAAGE